MRGPLEGIAVELRESTGSIKDSIELTNERTALGEFRIEAAADAEVVRASPGRFRRSAGISTVQQLMSAPASTHVIPVVDVEDAMVAYGRMLGRPDFIAWVPTILFSRTGDLISSNRWRATARDLRARVLARPGVSEQGFAAGSEGENPPQRRTARP